MSEAPATAGCFTFAPVPAVHLPKFSTLPTAPTWLRATTLGLGVLGATFAPAARLGAAAAPAATEAARAPRLVVPDANHDFGTVPQGKVVEWSFPVQNTGSLPLEISDVQSSCGCTTAGAWTRRLEPGQSGSIPIRLDTAQFVGPLTKTIAVSSNDPVAPKTILQIKATIWTPVSVTPHHLLFPAITDVQQPASRRVVLRREVEGTLTPAGVASDNALFEPTLREITAGTEYELIVALKPPLPEGTQTGKITLRTGLSAQPTLVVPVVAAVLPPVQVAPTKITLPRGRLAAAEKRFAVLINHRGANLLVSDLSTDAPGVTLATAATPDGKQFTIILTFPAGFEMPAGVSYHLQGQTNQPSLAAFSVPIRLRE